MKKLLTNDDFYFHVHEKESENYRKSEMEAKKEAEEQNKKFERIYGSDIKKILTGALNFGLSEDQFLVFFKSFHSSTLIDMANFHLPEGKGYDAKSHVNIVYSRAEVLEREELIEYFLDNFLDSFVKRNKHENKRARVLQFKKLFVDKRDGLSSKGPTFNPIKWKGTQKQLAELFITLEEKGWIEKMEYKAIKQCFTKSNTIQQVLKPGIDPKNDYQKVFDQVYTPNYESMFFGIKNNPKRNS